jgi:hypothetical protein
MGGNMPVTVAFKWFCKADAGCRTFLDLDDFIAYTSKHLGDQLQHLNDAGKRVVVLLPFPVYVPLSPPDYLIATLLSRKVPVFKLTRQKHLNDTRVIAKVWTTQAAAIGATIIDPSEVLCPLEECEYQRNNVSLYKDEFHLTSEGARLLKPLLVRSLAQH